MKIKITKSCSGYDFSFKQGDIVDVTEHIGKDLVNCGYAERVQTPATETKRGTAAKKVKADADA